MARFNGKNSTKSSIRLAIERAKYEASAFPENGGLGPEQIVNFNFAEKGMYGKVDVEHNPVYPNQEYIIFMCDLYYTFTGNRSCAW